MAMQETAPASPPRAEVVGNAFVQQYYHILHQSPELVHRFYHDSSLLSRPDSNGAMTVVTTMQAINDKILSLNYGNYTAEIKTADAQESHEKGVIVLVTGFLTGIDSVKKKFTQTFFLAPQDKGYFVLNDVFRFIGESESLPNSSVSVNGDNEKNQPTVLTPEPGWDDVQEPGWDDVQEPGWDDVQEPEPTAAADNFTVDPTTSFENENLNDDAGVCDPSDKEEGSVIEDEVVEPTTEEAQSEILTSVDLAPSSMEDTPKKSYASILKVMKAKGSSPAHVPTTHVRVAPANTKQQFPSAKPASAPEPTAPSSGSPPESSDVQEEAEGHSIFVRNLPFNATVTQLEEAFKKFGPIKQGGIQVRSNKQGFCFGFVEFESLGSMRSALEGSPVMVGDRQADVEEKRTNTRVGSGGRGRYSSARVAFRSESFKNRGSGSFGGGRGYGRNEFRNQGEFSGRPRGSSGRNGEDQQRATNQNGNSRRGGRQGGTKGGPVATST